MTTDADDRNFGEVNPAYAARVSGGVRRLPSDESSVHHWSEFEQAYCQHGANRGQIIFLVVKVLSAQGDVTLPFLDKFFTILVRSELHLLACERLGVTYVHR
jgi:hypothetical protein